MNKTF